MIGAKIKLRQRSGHRHGVPRGGNAKIDAPQKYRLDHELLYLTGHAGSLCHGVLRGRRTPRIRPAKRKTRRKRGLILFQTDCHRSALPAQGKIDP